MLKETKIGNSETKKRRQIPINTHYCQRNLREEAKGKFNFFTRSKKNSAAHQ
jgi:hypothetical protein